MPTKLPDITVRFRGLILLQFDLARPHCEVSLHRVSYDHVPSIVVTKKKARGKDETLWKYYGHLPDELWLDVVNMQKHVKVHKIGDELNRKCPKPEQERDIRWAIDFHSDDFHDRPLEIRPEGVGPGMYMTRGLFYTSVRTDNSKFTVIRKFGGKEKKELYSIASEIAADISFEGDDSKVILQWGGSEAPVMPLLKRKSGVRYEIIVDNSPSLEVVSREDNEKHSDLRRYYQVLADVPPSERFDLAFPPLRVSDDVPCMTSILGIP